MTDAEIRDLDAANAARQQYEQAAYRFFELEDEYRQAGLAIDALGAHHYGCITGHAAWAELRDPEPPE